MTDQPRRWRLGDKPVVLRRRATDESTGAAPEASADDGGGKSIPRRGAVRLGLRSIVATAFVLFVSHGSLAAVDQLQPTTTPTCSNAQNNNCTSVNTCTTANPNSCVVAFNSCTGQGTTNTCEGENSNTCQSGHGSNDCSGGAENTCTGDKSNTCTAGSGSNDCSGSGSANTCSGDPADFCHTYSTNNCSGGATNTCSSGWTEDGDVCTIKLNNGCDKTSKNTTSSTEPVEQVPKDQVTL